jgi:Tfp pilus assembly protein FimT
MDEIRDIQKQSPISRFFDKHVIRTNPFGANQSVDRAYRRAERIVAALYMITNHIPDTESLRTSVRAGAILFLENVLSLQSEMRSPDSRSVIACRASIRHLISLVRMLAVSGFVSLQNTNTVVEALDELGNFLAVSQTSPLSESVSLSREDFLDTRTSVSFKDIKDNKNVKDAKTIKDTQNTSDMTTSKDSTDLRKQSIIEVLRAGGSLGIRDISSNLPEYSEKMIQRELAELVVSGNVKKNGLKRWSRYALAL